MESTRRWIVTSPEYNYVEPVLEDGSGPIETACDYAEVIAPTRRAAKILAVKAWRTGENNVLTVEAMGDLTYCDQGNVNPFTGLKTEEVFPCPQHGWEFEQCEVGVCIPYNCPVCDEDVPVGKEVPIEPGWVHEFCALPLEERMQILLGDYLA